MFSKILIAVGILIVGLAVFVFVARKRSAVVHVERVVSAPVEKVWALWNDPEAMKKWWGPTGYTAPVIKNDLRVGGSFLLSMRSPKGEMFWNTGSYREIITNQKIVSSLSFSDENGTPVPGEKVKIPGEWPDSVTVTVEFKPADGKTTISITEVGIPMIMKVFAKMGWEQQLDKFTTLL